jgi:hypothetical protein
LTVIYWRGRLWVAKVVAKVMVTSVKSKTLTACSPLQETQRWRREGILLLRTARVGCESQCRESGMV